MIADHDILRLPAGVELSQGRLSDTVRGASWPLNASGEFVLARAGRPLGMIVEELAGSFALPLEVARRDALRFVWYLNGLALANLESRCFWLRRVGAWVRLAARLAPAGGLPSARTRRRPLDTSSAWRAVVTGLAASAPRMALVSVVATGFALHVFVLAGGSGLAGPVVLGLATGAGLGLHEAAHAAPLRGVPTALVTRGPRTYLLHRAVGPTRRCAVALAGPLVVAMLGLACVVTGDALANPSLGLAGCPLAGHALALTTLGGDGRIACGL